MAPPGNVDISALLAAGAAQEAIMPSIYELCVELPLYTTLSPTNSLMLQLRGQDVQFDAFCTECGRDAVFRSKKEQTWGQYAQWMRNPVHFWVDTKCGRAGHTYITHFYFNGEVLIKIGQYPSIADVTGADLRKYRPLLKGGYYEELNKAVGLISHGVGVGSFVYLRRIFERLIAAHYEQFEASEGKPAEGFTTLRMDEKIALLKDFLPPALVRNRATYSILSKGIHELSEVECKLYFPVVKAAILEILEQDYEARERKLKADQLEAEIARINLTLKNDKGAAPAA